MDPAQQAAHTEESGEAMIKRIGLIIILALTFGLAGCDPEPTGGHPQPKPPANGGHVQEPPNPDANKPAPVQGDPEAHNTQEGYVVMFVTWKSETKRVPSITATKNGVPLPLGNISPPTNEADRAWHGDWEYEEQGVIGTVYSIKSSGPSLLSVACEIGWKGQFHSDLQRSSCNITFTLN